MTKELLNAQDIDRIVSRIAYEIIEKNKGCHNLCFVGIQRAGVVLARRLAERMKSIEGYDIPTAALDITFYRDDLDLRKDQPVARKTDIPFKLTGMAVVLVDDVIFTGRSVRAALDALMDLGRPSSIQLAVLIDRGHRELPISADYTGKHIPTARSEIIKVLIGNPDHEDMVVLIKDEQV